MVLSCVVENPAFFAVNRVGRGWQRNARTGRRSACHSTSRRASRKPVDVRTLTETEAPLEHEISEPSSFDWFKHWWPVDFTFNLDDDRPNRIQLLGEFFAVWKSKSGEWIAMKDMCPHRLAPLSEGAALQNSLSA